MNAFEHVSLEAVREYWNRRPCNIRHSPQPVGTKEYFEEVERRKYLIEPHIPAFAEFPRWRGKRVLEIGCGIGTDTINFARAGADVVAVELSDESLRLARRRSELFDADARVTFFNGNAEDLSEIVPAGTYDLVYSFGVIHHSPHPERILEQSTKYMKSGGTLKLMVYNRRSWKVLWMVLKYGKGNFARTPELIAEHSEAQFGSPVTYAYTRRELRRLVERFGFRIDDLFAEHIFPWRIPDYLDYRYVKVWYFRWIPHVLFRRLERLLGWHLCVTATYGAGRGPAA